MLSLSTRSFAYLFMKLKVDRSTEESSTNTTSYPVVLSVVVATVVVVILLVVVGEAVVDVVVAKLKNKRYINNIQNHKQKI